MREKDRLEHIFANNLFLENTWTIREKGNRERESERERDAIGKIDPGDNSHIFKQNV